MLTLPQGLRSKPVDNAPAVETSDGNDCFSCLITERLKMLADGRFWVGVFVGAGALYGYQRYKVKKAGG